MVQSKSELLQWAQGGFPCKGTGKETTVVIDHHPNCLYHPNPNLNGFLINEILRHTKTRKPYIPLHNIAKFKCVYTNFGSKTLNQSSFT